MTQRMRDILLRCSLLCVLHAGMLCAPWMTSAWSAEGGREPLPNRAILRIKPPAADTSTTIDAWSQAIAAAASRSDVDALMDALLQRAEAYRAAGIIEPATADLLQCRALAQEKGDLGREAAATGALGSVYYANGSLTNAAEQLEESLRLGREAERADLVARSLINLAVVETTNLEADLALSHLDQARHLIDPSSHSLLALVDLNVGRAMLAAGRFETARSMLVSVGDALLRLPAAEGRSELLAAVAASLLDLREFSGKADRILAAATYRYLGAAANDGVSHSPAIDAAIVGDLARLYALEGRHEEALELARRAIATTQLEPVPGNAVRWHWLAARQLGVLGREADAKSAYERAIAEVRAGRYDLVLAPDIYGRSFRETVGPLFTEYVSLLLEEARHPKDETARRELLEAARETLEVFKSAELEEYFRDDCIASFLSTTRSVDVIDPSTIVIYPIVLPERLVLIVSSQDTIQSFDVAVGSGELTDTIRAFRRGLEKVTTRDYLAPSRELYDWIFRPIEDLVASLGARTLLFVPDGALRTIPIGALNDGQQFLVERYAIAVAPGLNLIDPRPIDRSSTKLLVGALTEARGGFAGLPSVAEEIETVGAVFGGRVLRDDEFTLDNLRQALTESPYTIVHFASHGQLGRKAESSFVLTHDGRLSLDDLQSLMGLRQFREDSVELLVLSACQTAAGDDRAALGLAGVALKSGARSAIASLWFVNDTSAASFVAEFYRRLSDPSVTKAEAVRQAQVAMIGARRFRHPGYWAPYLLIGNWL